MCLWNFSSLQTNKSLKILVLVQLNWKLSYAHTKEITFLPALLVSCVSLGASRQKAWKSSRLGVCDGLVSKFRRAHGESVWEQWQKQFFLGCNRDSLYRFSLPPFPSDFRGNVIVLQAQRGCMWPGNWGCGLIFIQFLDGLSAVHWPNAN